MRGIVAVAVGVLALATPSVAWATDLAHARETLRTDDDAFERELAAHVLAAEGDAGDVPLLAEHLQTDTDEGVRAACARALGILGGDAAVGALLGAMRDPSPTVRGFVRAGIAAASPRPSPTGCGDVIAAVLIHGHDLVLCSDGTHELRRQSAVYRAHTR